MYNDWTVQGQRGLGVLGIGLGKKFSLGITLGQIFYTP